MSRITLGILFSCVGVLFSTQCEAQLEFENPPVSYSLGIPQDSISRLQKRMDAGEVELTYREKGGYLPALLEALEIPISSQMLVFSKTSLQLRRISPQRPRALYFNDDSYIGWVQGGDVIEISTADSQLGAIFYTLSTEQVERPRFLRDQGQCITCHASSRTEGVPGHLMRSVYPDRSGQPHYGSGTYSTTQSSPFEKRWGGWYVTGTHGELRHMGNMISTKDQRLDDLDRDAGANVTDLRQRLDVSPYLVETSDIVPMLVLGHQLEMHNLLTRGNFETRSALHYDSVMNTALERNPDYISESTERRIAAVGDKILMCMLFADEYQLTDRVQGVSTFQSDFEALGIKDTRGRSLRDLDLHQRLFKYPCSYLIYSDAFDALPEMLKSYVVAELLKVLKSDPDQDEFKSLAKEERQNILQILLETKPTLFPLATESPPASLPKNATQSP